MERPFPAYSGEEDYVFICYAHADSTRVFQELSWLNSNSINVWYDEGIRPGENWRLSIGDALLGASHILFYVSHSSVISEHCNREIHLALDEGKRLIPIFLEDTELTTDLRVGLSNLQSLNASNNEHYRDELKSVLSTTATRSIPSSNTRKPKLKPLFGYVAGFLVLVAFLSFAWYFLSPGERKSPASNLAEQAMKTEDLKERIELLEKSLELAPDNLDVRANLAYSLIEAREGQGLNDLGAFQRARQEAHTILGSNPEHSFAYLVLARTYLQLDRDAPRALEAFRQAEALGANKRLVDTFKAAIFMNTGKFELAAETMQQAHDQFPNDGSTADLYARSLFMNGRVDEAWQMFDKSLRLGPRRRNTINHALIMAAAVRDIDRLETLVARISADALPPQYGQPLIDAVRGDPSEMQELLSFYERNREDFKDQAYVFTEGYWWAKDYEKHIIWWKKRVKENGTLYFANFHLAAKPNYWEILVNWAGDSPTRQQLIQDHEQLLNRITTKMVLESDPSL